MRLAGDVTDALPLMARWCGDCARTGGARAVKRPPALRVPTVVDQVNVGWIVKALLNWSLAVAVNCCVAAALRLTDAGLTTIVVIAGSPSR